MTSVGVPPCGSGRSCVSRSPEGRSANFWEPLDVPLAASPWTSPAPREPLDISPTPRAPGRVPPREPLDISPPQAPGRVPREPLDGFLREPHASAESTPAVWVDGAFFEVCCFSSVARLLGLLWVLESPKVCLSL